MKKLFFYYIPYFILDFFALLANTVSKKEWRTSDENFKSSEMEKRRYIIRLISFQREAGYTRVTDNPIWITLL